MKILLVTPVRQQPGDPHRLWLKALKQRGCRVEFFPLTGRSRLINSWRLFNAMVRFKPDQVFFSAGRNAVYPVKDTVFFCGVPPVWLSRSERATGLLAKLVVVNDDGHGRAWKKLGAKKIINLPISGVDPDQFQSKPLQRKVKVSFVGSLFADRQRQLVSLIKLVPDLQVWGWLPPEVKLFPGLKQSYQGEAWGAKLARVYQQSLISINLAPAHMQDGGNIRLFEIAAAGALLLTNQLNPNWLVSAKEAVMFHGIKDCAQKINFYLKHPDLLKKIAVNGRRRVLKDHTYFNRFSRLIAGINSPV